MGAAGPSTQGGAALGVLVLLGLCGCGVAEPSGREPVPGPPSAAPVVAAAGVSTPVAVAPVAPSSVLELASGARYVAVQVVGPGQTWEVHRTAASQARWTQVAGDLHGPVTLTVDPGGEVRIDQAAGTPDLLVTRRGVVVPTAGG